MDAAGPCLAGARLEDLQWLGEEAGAGVPVAELVDERGLFLGAALLHLPAAGAEATARRRIHTSWSAAPRCFGSVWLAADYLRLGAHDEVEYVFELRCDCEGTLQDHLGDQPVGE